MIRALRLALVVLGLAAFVYGTASLTGDWLGTAPWWIRSDGPFAGHPGEQREFVSVLVALVGVGLTAGLTRHRLRRLAIRPSVRLTLAGIGLGVFSYATFWRPDWLWDHFLRADEGDAMHTNFSPRYFLRVWPGRGIYLEAILLLSGALAFVSIWPGEGCLRRPHLDRVLWLAAAALLIVFLGFLAMQEAR